MMKDHMGNTHVELERTIARLKEELQGTELSLQGLQSRCPHRWDQVKYTPEIHEGYRDPGDPPGTMGVDWRGPMWVPRQETPRWTRICLDCGKKEVTERTRDDIKKVPVFNDRRY